MAPIQVLTTMGGTRARTGKREGNAIKKIGLNLFARESCFGKKKDEDVKLYFAEERARSSSASLDVSYIEKN